MNICKPFLFVLALLLSVNVSGQSGASEKTVQTREGYKVRVVPGQASATKEVHYFPEDNEPAAGDPDVRLLGKNSELVEERTFHLDDRGRLWHINMSKGTIAWCNDPLTISFYNKVYDIKDGKRVLKTRKKMFLNAFNGIRFIFEPNFGPLIDQGSSHIVAESFITIPRIGLESNLVSNWVALQAVVFYPGTVQYDAQSSARRFLIEELREDGRVDVNRGFAFGLSLFDGALVAGYGKLKFDKRDFIETAPDHMKRKDFFFVNFQAITTLRKVISTIKER